MSIYMNQLQGERGLLVAIIGQAVKDASSRSMSVAARVYRADALRWFNSAEYQAALTALGLPSDFMPICLEKPTATVRD